MCGEVMAVKERTRGKVDLLSGYTGVVLTLGAAFLLGGLLGLALAENADAEALAGLRSYLNSFRKLFLEGGVSVPLLRLLWLRMNRLLLLMILSCVPAGTAAIPLCFGFWGMRLAHSAACLFLLYGRTGLWLSFVLFGLGELLLLPLLTAAGAKGLLRTLGRADADAAGWRLFCAAGCVLLVLCVLIEHIAVPALLGTAAQYVL